MATYSGGEALVNILKVTQASGYSVPAGRYAKVTIINYNIGAGETASIGDFVLNEYVGPAYPSPPISQDPRVMPTEIVITSGESIGSTGSSTITCTVREFNNP